MTEDDVTRQTINAIENNKYDPTLALAFKLSKVLGVTVDELFICINGDIDRVIRHIERNDLRG